MIPPPGKESGGDVVHAALAESEYHQQERPGYQRPHKLN
jgi:hypothetical protein